MDFGTLSTGANAACFATGAFVIAAAGTKLTKLADRLADRTGMGEALAGALFLGASTSLPGITASVTAAHAGFAELAVSNAVGGIAAQTAFLAIADICYPRANLEHAAASGGNLLQNALLLGMLAIPLAAQSLPSFTVWNVHPATLILFAFYCFGMALTNRAKTEPMWVPRNTQETVADIPDDASQKQSLLRLVALFVMLAGVVAVSGWIIAKTGVVLSQKTGLSQSAVGGFFTAVASSLPELITSIAAVRSGALTLAVGGIIGGNAFDVLFLAASDIAYQEGSIYHQMSTRQNFLMSMSILMSSVLLLGLLYRQKEGFARIGFESVLILVLYVITAIGIFTAG